MLLAPGGTSKPILEKLNKAVNAAVHSPEMNTPLEKLGMIGLGDKSLEQLDDYVRSETVRWATPLTDREIFFEKKFFRKRDSHVRRLGANKDQVPLPDKGMGGGGTTFRALSRRPFTKTRGLNIPP